MIALVHEASPADPKRALCGRRDGRVRLPGIDPVTCWACARKGRLAQFLDAERKRKGER